MSKPFQDYVIEEALDSGHYNFRILSGRYAGVLFRYGTVNIKKRWLRSPDVVFTYDVIEDDYQEVAKAPDGFDKITREILESEFFSLQ